MLNVNKIRDYHEAAHLQYYLIVKGYKLIYINEFHVSMHSDKLYNWKLRSSKALITVNPSSWTMSFCIAFSEKKIEAMRDPNLLIHKFYYVFMETYGVV